MVKMIEYKKPEMFEWMRIKITFSTGNHLFKKGELYPSSDHMKMTFTNWFNKQFLDQGNEKWLRMVEFVPSDEVFARAQKDGNFSDLIMVRYGGIGDLIALTSVIDYFEGKRIHFITQEKYFAIFDWFENKPKVYDNRNGIKEPKYKKNWACYHSLNLIENGHDENWYHLFFKFIEEDNPGEEFYRPVLKKERISNRESNIYKSNKPSLLIVNRSTAMMRTIRINDILQALPNKETFNIFVYEMGVDESINGINIIKSDLADLEGFLLDCYDADYLISVDTGALHFREGIEKPAIGLYNSFTTDSRTKYYEHTKSFDIKSDCEHQPCFWHERAMMKYCIKGNQSMFSAPCFDSKYNDKWIEQLIEIFKKEV